MGWERTFKHTSNNSIRSSEKPPEASQWITVQYISSCYDIKKKKKYTHTRTHTHTHTHTHAASFRPAAERLLQPSSLPPFEFSFLSFLTGCKHICKLFRGEHIYAGDQAPSLSVGPRNCSNSPCIYTFDDRSEARKRVKGKDTGFG